MNICFHSIRLFQAEALDVEGKYNSLKEEAEALTKKLKVFEKKYKEAKQEVSDKTSFE